MYLDFNKMNSIEELKIKLELNGFYCYYQMRSVLRVGNNEELCNNIGVCFEVAYAKNKWVLSNSETMEFCINSNIWSFCHEVLSLEGDITIIPEVLIKKYSLIKMNLEDKLLFEEDLYEESSKYPPDDTLFDVTKELDHWGIPYKRSDFGVIELKLFTLFLYNNHWYVKLSNNQIFRTSDSSIPELCSHICRNNLVSFEVTDYYREVYSCQEIDDILNKKLNKFVNFVKEIEGF